MRFSCPQCTQVLEVDQIQAGRMVQCPKCQKLFNAPAAGAVSTPMAALPGKRPPTPGMAVWSMVLGILGVITCVAGFLFGIPAVILGHISHSRIRSSNGALGGQGVALSGFILGYIAIGLSVLLVLPTAIAIPSFLKARQTSQRAACINNLRLIDHAKQQLAVASGTMSDSYVPTMAELQPYLTRVSACFEGGVYSVNCITSNPTCSLYAPPHNHKLSSGF
jgi:predicted Zn finger-like uncharacterized protein